MVEVESDAEPADAGLYLSDLNVLPYCALVDQFARNTVHLTATQRTAFTEAMSVRGLPRLVMTISGKSAETISA